MNVCLRSRICVLVVEFKPLMATPKNGKAGVFY